MVFKLITVSVFLLSLQEPRLAKSFRINSATGEVFYSPYSVLTGGFQVPVQSNYGVWVIGYSGLGCSGPLRGHYVCHHPPRNL
jgi:hypothetical protein